MPSLHYKVQHGFADGMTVRRMDVDRAVLCVTPRENFFNRHQASHLCASFNVKSGGDQLTRGYTVGEKRLISCDSNVSPGRPPVAREQ